MPYPRDHSIAGKSLDVSPCDPPVGVILSSLSLLLTDPKFKALEPIIIKNFDTVDDLRANILVNSHQFSTQTLHRMLEEIDRAVDHYQRGATNV